MKIAFDFTPVIKEKYTGFYTYGINLLQAMQKLKDCPDFDLLYYSRFNEAAFYEKGFLNSKFNLKATSIKPRWLEKIWSNISFPSLEYFIKDFDLYHSFYHFMPPVKGKPRVLTVYDLRRYKYPEIYKKSKTEYFENAVKKCDHIISISDATTKDLIEIFKLSEQKITRIYLGPDADVDTMNQDRRKKAKDHISSLIQTNELEYFITISASDERKNIARTIEAFLKAGLPENCKLVVVGFLPKNNEDLNKIMSTENAKSKVFILGAVEDINAYIAEAKGLIFASLYEGFGIPIINAMKMKIPVITSNLSSMPEAGGDAALYIDPFSVKEICESINKVYADNDLRDRLICKGIENSKRFAWKLTAQETLEVYKKLV